MERADLNSVFDWLLGFGEQAEILEPQEYQKIREQLLRYCPEAKESKIRKFILLEDRKA